MTSVLVVEDDMIRLDICLSARIQTAANIHLIEIDGFVLYSCPFEQTTLDCNKKNNYEILINRQFLASLLYFVVVFLIYTHISVCFHFPQMC